MAGGVWTATLFDETWVCVSDGRQSPSVFVAAIRYANSSIAYSSLAILLLTAQSFEFLEHHFAIQTLHQFEHRRIPAIGFGVEKQICLQFF